MRRTPWNSGSFGNLGDGIALIAHIADLSPGSSGPLGARVAARLEGEGLLDAGASEAARASHGV